MDITRPRIPIMSEEIGIYRLNYDRLHKEIADALGIEFSSVDLDDAFFWELGCLKTGTGCECRSTFLIIIIWGSLNIS